ncbi:MAG: hypothetical protein ACM3NV_01155 [Syntrophothermus sp.]
MASKMRAPTLVGIAMIGACATLGLLGARAQAGSLDEILAGLVLGDADVRSF